MRAYRGHTEGKNFVWKIYCFFPLNLRVLPAISDGSICKKWMQNALRFAMKNRSFSFWDPCPRIFDTYYFSYSWGESFPLAKILTIFGPPKKKLHNRTDTNGYMQCPTYVCHVYYIVRFLDVQFFHCMRAKKHPMMLPVNHETSLNMHRLFIFRA